MKLKIFAVIHMICVWVFHPNPKWFMTRSMHLHNHVINYIHDDVILTWLFHWKQGVMMSLIQRIVLVIGWICVSNITYGTSFTQLNTLLPIRGRRNTSPAPYDVIIWWRHHVTTNRFQRRYNRVDHRSINFSPQFFEAPRKRFFSPLRRGENCRRAELSVHDLRSTHLHNSRKRDANRDIPRLRTISKMAWTIRDAFCDYLVVMETRHDMMTSLTCEM